MLKHRQLLIIEDDEDDQLLVRETIATISIDIDVVFFTDPKKAIDYLVDSETTPFLIICDVNLPGGTGIEFRRQIYEHPQIEDQHIPFVLLSGAVGTFSVEPDIYHCIHGYFVKEATFTEYAKQLTTIIHYWYKNIPHHEFLKISHE